MSRPVNETQRRFARLCADGGGLKGGPAKNKVLDLLRWSGTTVNEDAYDQTRKQFEAFPEANPWHVCFAVGLAWGHLAKLTPHVLTARPMHFPHCHKRQ